MKSVEHELLPHSASLYIFFGGISAGIGMPPFEFYKSSKIIQENKIFIRDFSQSWYHNGLPGISNDIYETADYLRGEIDKINPKKICFIGNSMGGFAAMVFAALIGEGEVVAFAPQTFISPWMRLWHRDIRWSEQIKATYRKSLFKSKVWDVKPLLKRQNTGQKISVFVSKDSRHDYIHATHIKNIPGVIIHAFNGGGHGIVKTLRDEGKLADIIAGKYTSQKVVSS